MSRAREALTEIANDSPIEGERFLGVLRHLQAIASDALEEMDDNVWIVLSDHYILAAFDNFEAADRYRKWADKAHPKKTNIVQSFPLKAR